jgi:DNA-binding transcriptional LysR family regulator
MMKPNQLRAFLAVVEQKSIRGAARKLGVTQPAITSAMRELESDLGVTLLQRSVSGVKCTTHGEAFARRASLLLSEMQRARDELDQISNGDVGTVSVAFSTAIAHTLLPRTFRAFRKIAPSINLRLGEASLPTSFGMLRDGTVDLIVSHMMNDSDEEFEVTPLYATAPVIVMRKDNPLAASTRLSELTGLEWLMPFNAETAPDLLQRFFDADTSPAPSRILQCTSTAMGLRLVGTQDLVGWFVESLPEDEFLHYGLVRVLVTDPLPRFKVCILTRAETVLTPAAQRFYRCVQDQAGILAAAKAS